MRGLVILVLHLALAVAIVGQSTDTWAGKWRGELVNYPTKAGAPKVEVVREVGKLPSKDGECAVFRTSYYEAGIKKATKNYELCLRAGDYAIDEGNGIVLSAGFLGGIFVAPFKYGSVLLVSVTRVEGDRMIEEIYTAEDRPAGKGVVALKPKALQKLVFQRVESRAKVDY